MKPLKLLTIILVFSTPNILAQEIWHEDFTTPNKGVWGESNSTAIQSDLKDIAWLLEYDNIVLNNEDDYAKTVSTSGGRFECRDINAEIIWRSEIIDISEYKNVEIKLQASETGSGANEKNKYLKSYYVVDDSNEVMFESKGENKGNWGSNIVSQTGLNGKKMQVIVYMNNHYSADKVILDEVLVSGEGTDPVEINSGDILINEILFNPVEGGTDYVEIYNNSEKQIPLNQLYLASRNNALELVQKYPLSGERKLLDPYTYLALTKDTNQVLPFFEIICTGCFLQMDKFPSFNNDEDYVVLLDNTMKIIDELYYNNDMHSPLIADTDGVSLERISFEKNTGETKNWHSASSNSKYGTPGYENSQHLLSDNSKPKVNFRPDSFSPNSDGYNDEFIIELQLYEPGYLVNISVFDAAGRTVLYLAKNELTGTSAIYSWNGEDETGQKQMLGVYIVLVELYNTKGNVFRYKEGVVLTEVLE